MHTIQDEERVAQPEKDDDELLHHPELPIHKLDPPPELDPNQPLPILAREAEFCEVLGITDDKGENMEILMQHQSVCTFPLAWRYQGPELIRLAPCLSRWTVCSDLQEVAEEYLDDAKLFPDSSVLHTDVLPMLREIVYGDDEQEQAYQIALHLQADDVVLDARVRRSRRLAGSGKEGFRRHLGLSREIANVIRDSGLAVQGIDERLNSEVSNALEYSNQGTNQKELARVNQVVKK